MMKALFKFEKNVTLSLGMFYYTLASRTTAVLFDPRTDRLPSARALGNRSILGSNKTAVVLERSQ